MGGGFGPPFALLLLFLVAAVFVAAECEGQDRLPGRGCRALFRRGSDGCQRLEPADKVKT